MLSVFYKVLVSKIWVFYILFLDAPSLLGLSNISVSTSIGINDTALTSATISRMETPDPIDNLDLTVCPADDVLDGCKVNGGYSFKILDIFCCTNKWCSCNFEFSFSPLCVVVQLYLCGLSLKKLEKLRRLVNAAGGLRFNQPSEELTHVVMGELDQELQHFLSKAAHRSELKRIIILRRKKKIHSLE